MVRMSDIIRGRRGEEPEEREGQMRPEGSERKVSSELYSRIIVLAEETVEKIDKRGEEVEGSEIEQVTEEMVEQLILKDITLLKLAVQSSAVDYPYSHMANVSILAVKIGLGFSFGKIKLVELGIAALFHDEKYLSRIKILNKFAQEKSKEDAVRFNEIIKVADIYETLTHSRSYRKEIDLYEVMKTIVEASRSFLDYEVVRILMRDISVYPLGCKVRLSSNEIGKVVGLNEHFPLRPKVEIEFDLEGVKLKQPKLIDLVKSPQIHIKGIVREEKDRENLKI